jgi:hypothetical protein
MSEETQKEATSVEASGGFAAPEEVFDPAQAVDIEETAIETSADTNPCWAGYEMIGMKVVDGKEVPNCVPVDTAWSEYVSREDLEELVSYFNSNVGPTRYAEFSSVDEVASRAAKKYLSLEDREEITNAIRWDVYGYLEYATNGLTASGEFYSEYLDLLPKGHPSSENPAVEDYASWISGAPGIDESSRDAIYASIVPSDDEVQTLHASTRVKTLVASGELPKETVTQIKEAILWSLSK